MKSKLILAAVLGLGSVVAYAQEGTVNNMHIETKAEKRERIRKEDHPNALTDAQRNAIKAAEDQAAYQRKMISFDPNLTPAQRRAKILETKKNFMLKVKSILTPQQYANVMIKKPKQVEEPVVAVNRPKGPITYEQREKKIMKTLQVESDSVRLEFYDNGAIDGDSISVFFNGKLIVANLMLTDKPQGFTVAIDRSLARNEVVMYAENLGTEPPNTALMVVKDGNNQYEVNVTSDLSTSGTTYLVPRKR